MWSWLWKWGWSHAHLDKLIERLLALPDAAGGLEDRQFCLSEREMVRLCARAREALLQEAALLELDRFAGETVLVGDLHGQFCDLQDIFQKVGRPGSHRRYIFLGDYVDRGECGLEIVACLLALKLRHPDRVFLLRGNHECTEITVMFGFCMECQRRSTLAVWEAAMQAFDALPLAALLGRHVLCVHGGISPQLGRLSDINGIQRPTDVNPAGAGLLVDLLWADPCTHTAGWCHSPRGVSYNFGLAAAREFMARTGVRSIIRAHMMQAEGFEVLGNHEVITVFSAVNYRGSGNTGAVLILDADWNMHFRTFLPPPKAAQAAPVSPEEALDALPLQQQAAEQQQPQQLGDGEPGDTQPQPAALALGLQRESAGSSEAGRSLQRTASAEAAAQEEIAEDLLAVQHQLPQGGKAAVASAGVDGDVAWRYVLPTTAGADVGHRAA